MELYIKINVSIIPLIFIFLLLPSLHLISQPTITANVIVNVGEAEPTMFFPANSMTWESGSEGENQTWNFGNLASGDACSFLGIDPVDSPYYDSFPESDIYFICTYVGIDGYTTENHTYYNLNNDILQLAGNVSKSITNPNFDSIFIVYTDPLDWGTFPYSFQDQTNDNFEARVTSYNGNQTIHAMQSGTSTQQVDSYGKLITPSGIFENTLRVKRIEIAENSIPGVPFSTSQESYRYTWYAQNEKGVILNLDSIVVKDFSGNPITTNYAGSYRIQGPTMTSTYSPLENAISIYPNPAIAYINIDIKNISNYDINIYSIDGDKIPFSIGSENENTTRIELNSKHFTDNLYLINIIDRRTGKKITRKLIVK